MTGKTQAFNNRFFSIAFMIRDSFDEYPPEHHCNPDTNYNGVKRACEMLDKAIAQARLDRPELPKHMPSVHGLGCPPTKPEFAEFIKDRLARGDDLGVFNTSDKYEIAKSLGVDSDSIVTQVGNWEPEEEPWLTWRAVQDGIKVQFRAVLEGDSLIGETCDLGHNWEGHPFFPYYVQVRPDDPRMSAMTNRELRDSRAPLELSWLTRTPWSEYDRMCFQYSFHTGDVQIGGAPRCEAGSIQFWRNEVEQWEKNLEAGLIPYAQISICLEGVNMSRDNELRLFQDLVEYLLDRGWIPVTGREFSEWYSERWPSPETPNQLIVFNDTSRQPDGQYIVPPWVDRPQSTVTSDMGSVLVAETKYFRVIDHQHRMSPFMEVAYELEAPNLYVAGYAGHDSRDRENRDGIHNANTFADGTGFIGDPDSLPVTAATGNALFWGNDPHRGIEAKWDYFACELGVEPDARNRCYSLLIDGKDVQFAAEFDSAKPYGEFFDLIRTDEFVSWKKRIMAQVGGEAIPIVISHHIEGKNHQIEYIDESDKLSNRKLELVFRPHFYQGWLLNQELNVYGYVPGMVDAFEYRVDNETDTIADVDVPQDIENRFLLIYHSDPHHVEMSRMLDIKLPKSAEKVTFVDKAGGWQYVEARVQLTELAPFTLRYKRMDPLG